MSKVIVLSGNISAFPSPSFDIYFTTPLFPSPEDINGISPESTSSAFISPFVNSTLNKSPMV